MGALSLFLRNKPVPSRGNGRQWHPKCVPYVQSIPWLCFDRRHCRKPCFTKIGCWKGKQGFQCFCGDLRIFCLNFNPEYRQSCCPKHSFKAAVIFNLQQLICFWHGQARFTWFVHKWIADPFFRSLWVFCGWEVPLELFQKQRQVIVHQLGEWWFRLSLFQNPC